jgi:hypothetical protein
LGRKFKVELSSPNGSRRYPYCVCSCPSEVGGMRRGEERGAGRCEERFWKFELSSRGSLRRALGRGHVEGMRRGEERGAVRSEETKISDTLDTTLADIKSGRISEPAPSPNTYPSRQTPSPYPSRHQIRALIRAYTKSEHLSGPTSNMSPYTSRQQIRAPIRARTKSEPMSELASNPCPYPSRHHNEARTRADIKTEHLSKPTSNPTPHPSQKNVHFVVFPAPSHRCSGNGPLEVESEGLS